MLELVFGIVGGLIGGTIATRVVLGIDRRQRVRRFIHCFDEEVSRALSELPPPRTERLEGSDS